MVGMLTYRTAGRARERFGREAGQRTGAVRHPVVPDAARREARRPLRPEELPTLLARHGLARRRPRPRRHRARSLRRSADGLVGVGIPGDVLYAPGEVKRLDAARRARPTARSGPLARARRVPPRDRARRGPSRRRAGPDRRAGETAHHRAPGLRR